MIESKLNFKNTREYRDFLIDKTLKRPNGPQTFTESNYRVRSINILPNVDPGDVKTNWNKFFKDSFGLNLFQYDKFDEYINLSNLNLQLGNNGKVYSGYIDSFTRVESGLVGIMTGKKFDNDSKLMKFAVKNIRENKDGPVLSRIRQNLITATLGRVNLIDALNGNLSTAIGIVTGKEPLIEKNYKITVSKSLVGKGIDFLQTVAGVEVPFSTIPGDYLTNPNNPIENGTQISSIGLLFNNDKKRRIPTKPSDLMIQYMGDGQKQALFNNLSYSKYSPNYTTRARSQQSSKILNFIDNVSKDVKNILGVEAPSGVAYIGDDRSEDVKYATADLNGNIIRSTYYLSLMFDPIAAGLFEGTKNISEGGTIGGPLTWISKNSINKLGLYNNEFDQESTDLNNSLSTKYGFRESSILGKTQEILDSMPKDGLSSKSHVGNVIDQTSRIFKEGDKMLSRGSAVQYVDKYTKQPTGMEYCRVWTKDRSYMNYSDTMKRTGNIRKFEDSVISTPWNLNIAPMSDGDRNFEGVSTNIFKGPPGDGFYAKKYMFSIENLAWKTSNTPGFTYNDLPYCERGPNGGRVMWFPPYDLKITESNSARWSDNTFLGRPEPIYTYQDTSRTGQLSFKIVVDHPSILNLLVREHFTNMSDEESENYIKSFFSGCEQLDFYDLIRKYTYLDGDDIKLILSYLEKSKDSQVIKTYKTVLNPIEVPQQSTNNNNKVSQITHSFNLKFNNDYPGPNLQTVYVSTQYGQLFQSFYSKRDRTLLNLTNDLKSITGLTLTNQLKNEISYVFGDPNTVITTENVNKQVSNLDLAFIESNDQFTDYTEKSEILKQKILTNKINDITITIESSASSLASELYNEKLSLRRSSSIINDFFQRISNGKIPDLEKKWIKSINESESKPADQNNPDLTVVTKGQPIKIIRQFKLSDFGYDNNQGNVIINTVNYGEKFTGNSPETNCIGKEFSVVKGLKINSPIAFFCRQSKVTLKYNEVEVVPPEPVIPPEPITVITPGPDIIVESPTNKPLIDPLKRIIMKTLSECYYFKKLEENSPLVFKSLKEKLKYFHPAFHSTTPEGLNSRLTFMLQCIRPGDTIPVKGIVDESDLTARNTSFGPPPVSVLRIGDFYHSKIIIRDVNFTYDEGIWDMNPEGIGMQPMIANVSCSIAFIGGQGLSKPIEKLQNALSSNFFANTEMYDERSISTNEKIDGKTTEEFTKEFLNELLELGSKPTEKPQTQNVNKISEGKYIGSLDTKNNTLEYTSYINDVFTYTEQYLKTYETLYNKLIPTYGLEIGKLLFDTTYRTIHQYDVYTTTNIVPGKTISLFGNYKKNKDLSVLKRGLLVALVEKIKSNNLSEMFNLDKDLSPAKVTRSNEFITPFIITFVEKMINYLVDKNPFQEIETTRNNLTSALDKLNYVIKFGKDSKIDGENVTSATLSGFTYDVIYNEYSSCIDYIEKNTFKLYNDLTTSIDFNNPIILDNDFKKIIKVLLNNYINGVSFSNLIMKEYEKDTIVFPENVRVKIKKRIEDFLEKPKQKEFKFSKFTQRKNSNTIKFKITESTDTNENVKEEIKKINSDSFDVTTKLNFYKTKK